MQIAHSFCGLVAPFAAADNSITALSVAVRLRDMPYCTRWCLLPHSI